MQRQRPTSLGAPALSNSQATVSVQSSQLLSNSEMAQQQQQELGASYVVSASGAQLRLGQHYQVSSTGAHELNPLTGSTTALGKAFGHDQYELGLAASRESPLKCRHISELDIDNELLIGQGSSAKVYQVVHKPSGVRVCVKQMHIDDSRHREEVKRELDSLHKAESRFIVDFYGAFFHNELGVILLVLELMEGSLADVMKERGGSLTEFEVKAFAYQIIMGLHFLHDERHLMHRDIKPANLLIHRGGYVKIADFGISRGQLSADPASVHTFVGSISYMSPERLSGSSYDYKSDIWSVGVVLCEAVTGAHPYHDDPSGPPPNFWDLLKKVLQKNDVLHQSPIKHKSGREHISDLMDNFVSRCLAFSKEERACAAELVDHPWFADMTMDRSEQVVRNLFLEIMSAKSVASSAAAAAAGAVPTAISDDGEVLRSGGASHPTTPGSVAPEESKRRSAMMMQDLMRSL